MFKSLCSPYNNFRQQPCYQSSQDLQRQIDALLGIATHGATLKDFSPKELIYAETLNLPSSLAQFLIRQSSISNKQITFKGLCLLQKMTFNAPSSYAQEIMKYLIKIIHSSATSDQALYSLYCLANLCRLDAGAQAFMNSMDDV